VSVADLSFILLILAPGHVPLVPGLLGPGLWGLAALFATLWLVRARPVRGLAGRP